MLKASKLRIVTPKRSLSILAFFLSLPGVYFLSCYFYPNLGQDKLEFIVLACLFFLASAMLFAFGAIAELLLENQRLLDSLLSRSHRFDSGAASTKTKYPRLKLVR
jgi:hypothetical protein